MTDHRHDIEKYINGELTPTERHALERKALNDPFLADALEGAEQLKHEQFLKDVDALKKKIAGKNMPTGQAGISGWMWPMRIAAGLAIIAVSSYIVWSVLEQEPPQDLALQKNETSPQPSTSSDSTLPTTEALSPVTEPSGAGPAQGEKDMASRSTVPSKAEAKSQPTTVDLERKIETEANARVADELETTPVEPLAQSKPIEKEVEIAAAKTDDIQRAKKLSLADDKKKEATPAAEERREAGVSSSSVSNNVIRGQVTSAEDGTPLPGVNVIIKGTNTGTATNEHGNYQVESPVENPILVYNFIGLQTQEIKTEDIKEVDVQLALDVTQLSEVVVTGYGTQTGESLPPTVDMAHPEIGDRGFKQYLEKNLRYPEPARINKVEGRVTVEFTIEPNGSLTNFNVIRGIGSGCDEELIRLIKEGPKWISTKKDGVPVQGKAKVRLKFEL